MAAGPTWTLSDDRASLALEVGIEPNAIRLDLATADVDSLIELLITARANMVPVQGLQDPGPGTRILTSDKGRWFVQSSEKNEIRIGFMIPGLGWVGIPFMKEQATDFIAEVRRRIAPLKKAE